MATKRKRIGAVSIPAGLLTGLAVSAGITIVGCALTAYGITKEMMDLNQIGWYAIVTVLLSSAFGAWAAAVRIRVKTAMVCAMSAGLYYLTLLGMTALFFGGQYAGTGAIATMVLLGACVALLLKNLKKINGTGGGKIKAFR